MLLLPFGFTKGIFPPKLLLQSEIVSDESNPILILYTPATWKNADSVSWVWHLDGNPTDKIDTVSFLGQYGSDISVIETAVNSAGETSTESILINIAAPPYYDEAAITSGLSGKLLTSVLDSNIALDNSAISWGLSGSLT
jgi:hypothetical protein